MIPEKIYFKIGEVCELVGVQAHVLRYWETEFPMLSPQKNKSGQRSYRRRDVEIALRIKQLLYNEMFTIAGARKKLQTEQRGGAKAKSAAPPSPQAPPPTTKSHSDGAWRVEAPMLFDTSPEVPADVEPPILEIDHSPVRAANTGHEEVLRNVAGQLLELREMLRRPPV